MLHYDPDTEQRQHVSVRARLRDAFGETAIRILEVSPHELVAVSVRPPKKRRKVELIVGSHSIRGRVNRVDGRQFGVVFNEPISVFALLSGDGGPIALRDRHAASGHRARRSAASGYARAGMIRILLLLALLAGAGILMSDFVREASDMGHNVTNALSVNDE